MNRLQELLGPRPDPLAVEAYLDGLDGARRVTESMSLGPRHQRRLFDALRGRGGLFAEQLVPAAVEGPLAHEGRNTLPAFARFEKVFLRPPEGGGDELLWGYNRTGPALETAVGPGYFVVRPHGEGELLVDYRQIPARPLPGAPPLLPNEARLGRFVYAGTEDVLRRASRHVVVGRARKGERWLPAWFVLCRGDA
ncbi:MAG: hypothetical protein AAGH15_06550 [Myxococcota bacterium]